MCLDFCYTSSLLSRQYSRLCADQHRVPVTTVCVSVELFGVKKNYFNFTDVVCFRLPAFFPTLLTIFLCNGKIKMEILSGSTLMKN